MFPARIVVCDSSAVLPLYLRCADEQTLPHGWKIVEFSMLEPESRIELLTYSLRVSWHSTLC
jgi:hypothetical protein